MDPFVLNNQQSYLYWLCIITYLLEWIVLPYFKIIINIVILIPIILIVLMVNKGKWIKIYMASVILGMVANVSHRALIKTSIMMDPNYFGFHRSIFLYMMLLSVFHMFEFVCISYPKLGQKVKFSNYLLNPSDDYHYEIALITIVIEFFVSSFFFPQSKYFVCYYSEYFGLSMAIVGDCIRKFAILNAGKNFDHVIQEHKSNNNHRLITTGIYSWCRHPSYVGWSMFAIGLQIMVGNVISLGVSIITIYFFFRDRIRLEEASLLRKYKIQYRDYMERTPFGYPFVS